MMRKLLNNWPQRLMAALVCIVAVVACITTVLTVTVKDSPARYETVSRIPLLGRLAIALAGAAPVVREDESTSPRFERNTVPAPADGAAPEAHLQHELCRQHRERLAAEQRRMTLYREDLARERAEIDAIRQQMISAWHPKRSKQPEDEQQTAAIANEHTHTTDIPSQE